MDDCEELLHSKKIQVITDVMAEVTWQIETFRGELCSWALMSCLGIIHGGHVLGDNQQYPSQTLLLLVL